MSINRVAICTNCFRIISLEEGRPGLADICWCERCRNPTIIEVET